MTPTQSIRNFRIQIDILINSIPLLKPSAEVTLAKRELQRCKMWLGKALSEFGSPTPYPESENPKSPVIEKQAEHTQEDLYPIFKDQIHEHDQSKRNIAYIKCMRAEIEKQVEKFDELPEPQDADDREKYLLFITTAYTALVESKMWLGEELNQIRLKEQNQPA